MKLKFALILLCTTLLLGSCGGKKADKAHAMNLTSNISSVNVVIGNIPADRRTAVENHKVASRIQNGVTELLKMQGKYTAKGTAQLDISVTAFRLRSGASAFWLGPMAGADYVSADIDVMENGKNTRTFSTSSSTVMGGMIKPSPSQRINGMAKDLSKKIIRQL